ncbi:putative receptor-like protein kinase [Glycine soja]|uniref:Putative receptor-like protein kinase n=1 Tax=Glycine soja TaxID=3848 RepID=A0A445L0H5_GLYSO|nr:putative receptor-like protein kinase [Glycine soja]
MDERRVNTIAAISVIALIILIVVARVTLKLSKAFFLIFGAGDTVILAVFAYVLVSISYNRRRRLLESQLKSQGQELRIEYSFLRKVAGVPIKFRYKELEEATDGFQALIGKGASASVFKGILNDGTSVAVKQIDAEERGEKQFRSEVAAIASVHHAMIAIDVAIDVAKGLAYLHHACRSRILHLDVKPENILLDENFRALVSDFGLAKLIGKDESHKEVSAIRGTRGYLAPEWLLEKGISDKTDIYSYGMVLLEIVGGRKNMCSVEDESAKSKRKWQYFPKIVNEKVREGKLMEIIDHRLSECGGVDERQVRTLVYVALWSVQEKPRLRPSMAQVVDMLEGRVRVETPPDTRMVVVDFLSVDESATDSNTMPRLDFVSNQRTQSNVECSSTYSYATTVLSGR